MDEVFKKRRSTGVLSRRKMNKSVFRLYKFLRRKYGRPEGQWKLWRKRPKNDNEREKVIIGAILTQRANWKNVELAMKNLKEARCDSLKGMLKNKNRLVLLIKPSGFYKQKAGYLCGLAEFIINQYGSVQRLAKEPLPKLRRELLEIKGIGPETADSILLYALDKSIFVIDEYTRRLVKKRRLAKNFSYEHLQKLFESNLRKNYKLYQDFHALIVIDGKNNLK